MTRMIWRCWLHSSPSRVRRCVAVRKVWFTAVEPESEHANKVLAEVKVKTPLNGFCAEFPEKIGAVALNGRRFIYRIDQKETPIFHARPAL